MGKAYGHRKESKNDNLQTPYSMSEQLFENEPFDFTKDVLECACGEGAIQHVLNQKFKDVFAFDIREGFYYKQDFFDYKEKHTYIVSNPPFSKFNQFIEKSKEIAIEKFALLGKLDFLSGLARYQKGTYLDINYPLTKVYIFIRKPDLRLFDKENVLSILYSNLEKFKEYYKPSDDRIIKIEKQIDEAKKRIHIPKLREDGKYPTGIDAYAWYIWENFESKFTDKTYAVVYPYPVIQWIDNQKYVLKQDKKK